MPAEAKGALAAPGLLYLLGADLVVLMELQGVKARVMNAEGALKGVRVADLDGPLGLRVEPLRAREGLAELAARISARQREVPAAELWELLKEDETPKGHDELARLWFGEGATPVDAVAVARALAASSTWFARRGLEFTPKPERKVVATLDNLERQRKREAAFDETVQWFRRFLDGEVQPPPPQAAQSSVDHLKQSAIHVGAEGPDDSAPLLKALGMDRPEAPFELLVRLGIFGEHENLLLHRHEVPRVFPADTLAEAEAAAAAQRSPGGSPVAADVGREELTDRVFPIDDDDTRERDDALSATRRPEGGWTVGIHITDVASLVPVDGPMDREAQRRASTLYLPEGSVTMLPTAVSHDVLSLTAGSRRRALSVLLEVGDDLAVKSGRVARTWVSIARGYSYEEALAGMAGDGAEPDLAFLARLADKRRAERQAKGARLFTDGVELKVRVVDGEVTVKPIPRSCPARSMVAELMILANQQMAHWLKERGLPCIYRTHELPKNSDDAADGGFVPKVRITTEPLPHGALGVDLYTQASSPLRRYGDLLVQRQLAASLGAAPVTAPYRDDQLRFLVEATEVAQDTIRTIERWSVRYWVLLYALRQRDRVWPAKVVMDRRRDLALAELPDLQVRAPLAAAPGIKHLEGDLLEVRLVDVKPRRGSLRAEEARPL